MKLVRGTEFADDRHKQRQLKKQKQDFVDLVKQIGLGIIWPGIIIYVCMFFKGRLSFN